MVCHAPAVPAIASMCVCVVSGGLPPKRLLRADRMGALAFMQHLATPRRYLGRVSQRFALGAAAWRAVLRNAVRRKGRQPAAQRGLRKSPAAACPAHAEVLAAAEVLWAIARAPDPAAPPPTAAGQAHLQHLSNLQVQREPTFGSQRQPRRRKSKPSPSPC